jgi:BMFP domain-containing protein YqiC
MEKDKITGNKILDDIAKIAGDALGAIGSLKTETESALKSKFENYIAKMDLVTREEYNILNQMISKFREEQELLKKRIDELENKTNND